MKFFIQALFKTIIAMGLVSGIYHRQQRVCSQTSQHKTHSVSRLLQHRNHSNTYGTALKRNGSELAVSEAEDEAWPGQGQQ